MFLKPLDNLCVEVCVLSTLYVCFKPTVRLWLRAAGRFVDARRELPLDV